MWVMFTETRCSASAGWQALEGENTRPGAVVGWRAFWPYRPPDLPGRLFRMAALVYLSAVRSCRVGLYEVASSKHPRRAVGLIFVGLKGGAAWGWRVAA
jgi:hypothetical protein